jgi:hypothetical protein
MAGRCQIEKVGQAFSLPTSPPELNRENQKWRKRERREIGYFWKQQPGLLG